MLELLDDDEERAARKHAKAKKHGQNEGKHLGVTAIKAEKP